MLAFRARMAIQGLRSEQDAGDEVAVEPAAVGRSKSGAASIERRTAHALAYGACDGIDGYGRECGQQGPPGLQATRPKAKGLGRPHLWQESACKNRRCKESSALPHVRNSPVRRVCRPPASGGFAFAVWYSAPIRL